MCTFLPGVKPQTWQVLSEHVVVMVTAGTSTRAVAFVLNDRF